MLIKIQFSNFFSFGEQAVLNTELGRKPSASAFDIELPSGRRLNKAVAVVGANGSGKTQFIKPLGFLTWFITSSFLGKDPDDSIPFYPHALYEEEDTVFEIIFLLNEREHKYKLVINKGKVLYESLHRRGSRSLSYVFIREYDKKLGNYHVKQQGFGFDSSIASDVRRNASLIAAAHSYNVASAADYIGYFRRYIFNVKIHGRAKMSRDRLMESMRFFYQNRDYHESMEELICSFDLGLEAIVIAEYETKGDEGNARKIHLATGIHKSENQQFELSMFEESSGTQSAFVLLRALLPVLANGGVAIIDEIDNDLHPHMLPQILELFKFEHTNPHQAQLIFTCHTPEVLNLLKKHQVYLVEKNNQESEAWRLDEIQGLRADDNLYAKYMAGALGAVPSL